MIRAMYEILNKDIGRIVTESVVNYCIANLHAYEYSFPLFTSSHYALLIAFTLCV